MSHVANFSAFKGDFKYAKALVEDKLSKLWSNIWVYTLISSSKILCSSAATYGRSWVYFGMLPLPATVNRAGKHPTMNGPIQFYIQPMFYLGVVGILAPSNIFILVTNYPVIFLCLNPCIPCPISSNYLFLLTFDSCSSTILIPSCLFVWNIQGHISPK